MVRLALSNLVSYFKHGVLGWVGLKALGPFPSHSPIVEENTTSEGEQEVVRVSALGLDPILPRDVDSSSMSRDNNERADDVPAVDKIPLEIPILLVPRGDMPTPDDGEGPEGDVSTVT